MSDPYPTTDATSSRKTHSKSLLTRLLDRVRPGPEDRDQIKAILDDAHQRELIDSDSYSMIKGALTMSEQTVSDAMVPRSRMNILDIDHALPDLVAQMIACNHSRFPVFEGSRDNIIGMLIAKDCLRHVFQPTIDVRQLLRPVMFVPESKRLNMLLRKFKETHNHQAVVIDEHGGIAGLITMEDILEEIVGDIEDEFDVATEAQIFAEGTHQWRVLAETDIDDFNEQLHTAIPNDDYDSIGGWLGGELGHIPQRGDTVRFQDIVIDVLRADSRRALLLRVKRMQNDVPVVTPTP